MSIGHRPADSEDRRFIVHAWVSSYRGSDTAGFIRDEDWFEIMVPQVEKALSRPDVQTTVAYETTDPDRGADLYGFIVADVTERPVLVYYTYVKQAYRRSGIARGLFAAIGVDPSLPFNYTCLTRWCAEFERKIPMARWTPELGRRPKAERRQGGRTDGGK